MQKIRRKHNIDFDIIYCSPFRRCLQTANIIIKDIIKNTGNQLPEKIIIHYGFGEKMSEISKHILNPNIIYLSKEKMDEYLKDGINKVFEIKEEGEKLTKNESLGEYINRYKKTFNEVLGDNANKNILIVSHGDAVGAIHDSAFSQGGLSTRTQECSSALIEKNITLVDKSGIVDLLNPNRQQIIESHGIQPFADIFKAQKNLLLKEKKKEVKTKEVEREAERLKEETEYKINWITTKGQWFLREGKLRRAKDKKKAGYYVFNANTNGIIIGDCDYNKKTTAMTNCRNKRSSTVMYTKSGIDDKKFKQYFTDNKTTNLKQIGIGVVNGSVNQDMQEINNNRHRIFVLPSQLNAAEYPNPYKNGIKKRINDYHDDGTGGPAGQLAGDPGVAQFILDNASNEVRKPNTAGINNIRLMGKMEGITLKNGYLQIDSKIAKPAKFGVQLNNMTILGVRDVSLLGTAHKDTPYKTKKGKGPYLTQASRQLIEHMRNLKKQVDPNEADIKVLQKNHQQIHQRRQNSMASRTN